jgi:hypothetical protein
MPSPAPLPVAGISSRRSACDRCRAQKLRCLRARPAQPRCDRCERAGAGCATSPVFRMRRYTPKPPPPHGSGSEDGIGGWRGKRLRRGDDGIGSPLSVTRSPVEGTASPMEGVHSGRNGAGRVLVGSASLVGDMSAMPGTFARRSATESDSAMAATPASEGARWDTVSLSNFSMAFLDGMANLNGAGTSEAAGQAANASRPSTSRSRGFSWVPPNLDVEFDFGLFAGSLSNPVTGTPDSETARHSNQEDGEQAQHSATAAERLSHVSVTLTALLTRLEQPDVDMSFLLTPMDEGARLEREKTDGTCPIHASIPAVQILNATKEFIEALEALSGQARPKTAWPEPTEDFLERTHSAKRHQGSKVDGNDTSTGSGSNTPGSTASGIGDSAADTAASSPPSTNPRAACDGSDGNPDLPTMLLVLANYARVIRLFVIFFNHAHGLLAELAASDDPFLCPVRGVSFSQFPIRKCLHCYR